MDNKKYDDLFIEKFSGDTKDSDYLYEYKTGEFSSGEIIGMKSIPQTCTGATYNYDKSTGEPWTKFTQIGEFIGEEFYRETDLQFPICGGC